MMRQTRKARVILSADGLRAPCFSRGTVPKILRGSPAAMERGGKHGPGSLHVTYRCARCDARRHEPVSGIFAAGGVLDGGRPTA